MKLGVVFPQTEIGEDPGAVREFAQAVEDLGYDHLLAFDHVLGIDPQTQFLDPSGRPTYLLPEGASFDAALHGHWSAQRGGEPLVTLFLKT